MILFWIQHLNGRNTVVLQVRKNARVWRRNQFWFLSQLPMPTGILFFSSGCEPGVHLRFCLAGLQPWWCTGYRIPYRKCWSVLSQIHSKVKAEQRSSLLFVLLTLSHKVHASISSSKHLKSVFNGFRQEIQPKWLFSPKDIWWREQLILSLFHLI